MQSTPRAVLKWPGAKWQLAPWIVERLPAHKRYVEPYFGSGAVFFHKKPVPYEVINDRDGEIANLFRVIREEGNTLAALIEATPWAREEWEVCSTPALASVERARRFLAYCWQSYARGTPNVPTGWRTKAPTLTHWSHLPDDLTLAMARLRSVQIENRDAIDVITSHHSPDVLIYADPPYPRSLRRRFYGHEMTDGDHSALLDALLAHPGPVAVSGYHCELYDSRLSGWQHYEQSVVVEKAERRTEVLWVNRSTHAQSKMFEIA